jgi:PAS domain S-box-containing protein
MRRHPRALLPSPHDDTAEMDRLRHQLAVLTQRDQELFEGAPEACLVTDLAGTIQEANPRATTILHVAPPRLLGRCLSAFLAVDRAAFHARLNELQGGQPVHDWEVSVRPWHHAPFPTLLSSTPARTPQGQLMGLRWWLRDLTPLKRAEEALLQAHAMLDAQGHRHTAAVAVLQRETHHRLKNNFQVIASLLDLHADASADPRVRAALEACQHRLTAMALIHEYIAQSQDAARMDAAPSLHTLATRVFEAYRTEGQPVSLALHL